MHITSVCPSVFVRPQKQKIRNVCLFKIVSLNLYVSFKFCLFDIPLLISDNYTVNRLKMTNYGTMVLLNVYNTQKEVSSSGQYPYMS